MQERATISVTRYGNQRAWQEPASRIVTIEEEEEKAAVADEMCLCACYFDDIRE
jgi:hypothetical protein